MALEIKKVLNISEIPEEVRERHWLSRHLIESYVEVHLDGKDNLDTVDEWITKNYPELEEEDSFFIYIDI
jgi:hypothetical protein